MIQIKAFGTKKLFANIVLQSRLFLRLIFLEGVSFVLVASHEEGACLERDEEWECKVSVHVTSFGADMNHHLEYRYTVSRIYYLTLSLVNHIRTSSTIRKKFLTKTFLQKIEPVADLGVFDFRTKGSPHWYYFKTSVFD